MLLIRQDQMEIFRAKALLSFEDEMLKHLVEFSPPLYRATGEKQILEVIRFGVKRAERYGFTFRGPVRLYLELMLLFGSYFDNDPQYPWTTEILNDTSETSQMQRAEYLYNRVLDYQTRVVGVNDTHIISALQRISMLAKYPLQLPPSDIAFTTWMLQQIIEIYPQKAEYVGDVGLKMLINEGIAAGGQHGFTPGRPIVLIIVLMLAFGHGCIADPLYPWIGRAIDSDSRIVPAAQAERLERKAIIWLDHVLSGLYGEQK